jgi:hypothetical protein
MSVTQEALASVFAAQLFFDLISRALDKLGVAHCKGREPDHREQGSVNFL